MNHNAFPPGWGEGKIREVLEYYEGQTEEVAVAEDIEASILGSYEQIPKITKPSLPYGVRPTLEQVDQVLRGEMDVVPRYGFSYELLKDGAVFEDAKTHGYVIDEYVGDRNIYFAYRLWCHAKGRPFVAILQRESGNAVELDMTTTFPDEALPERPYAVLSEEAMAKIVYLFQVKLRGYCSWSPIHCKRENIKNIETAKEAAAMLYQIACEDVLKHAQNAQSEAS